MKIHITRIHRSTADKQGKPYVGKFGPYTRLGIQCQEFGQDWLSGYGKDWNASWKEGQEVELDIEKVTKDGRDYINFSKTDPVDEMLKQLNAAVVRISALEAWNRQTESVMQSNTEVSYKPFSEEIHEKKEIKESDLPF